MPVYEYQCKACHREFEYQQRMSDPEKTVCEACGGKLDRLISRTAFSLKGGGWYKDLYASTKPEAAAKPDGGRQASRRPGRAAEERRRRRVPRWSAIRRPGRGRRRSAVGGRGRRSGSRVGVGVGVGIGVGIGIERERRSLDVTAAIIDGKAIAARLRAEVAASAAALRGRGIAPCLAVVLVGDDPASAVYVRSKARAAGEVGVDVRDHKLPASTSQEDLLALVRALGADAAVDGILVQLPLPKPLDADAVIRAIDPQKDVDGLHPLSLGYLAQGHPVAQPCTPKGCMRLLREVGVELAGARAVVLGRSLLVGKPMTLLLGNANATVTMCHSRTRDVAAEVRRADVVVAAVGKPELVRGEWIADGAVVIDVGMNRLGDGRLVGDVEYAAAATRARAITPVPGGVGPMTIACLLENTVEAAARRRR